MLLLKAIHPQECRASVRDKVALVVYKLRAMKTGPPRGWSPRSSARRWSTTLSTVILGVNQDQQSPERVMREIWRQTRVVGTFPNGQSALMLVGARLRHLATSK